MSATRHTVRLHLLVREADVGAVSEVLRARLGDRVVGLVPQEDYPGLWAASGQWTPEEAAGIAEACAGLPVRVTQSVLLGVEEPPGGPGQERVTVRETFEAWSRDERAIEALLSTEKEGVHR